MDIFGLEILDIVIRLILGLIIGFCVGLTGVGGGVLVIPALTLLLHMNAVMAVGTASFFGFLTRISATLHHTRLKTIDWMLSLLFLAGAVPVNFLVASWIAGQGADEEFTNILKIFITCIVFFSIAVMIFNFVRKKRKSTASGPKSELADTISKRPVLRRVLGVLMGAIVGALIGATSIGGGVLIVPMLMIFFGLNAKQTVGSSIFIAVVLALITSMNYFLGENSMDAVTAVIMALGSIIGVYQGSKLLAKIPERVLQIIMISLILIAGVMMLFN